MFNPSLMAPQPGAGKPVVERETATSAAINANQAPGMLAAVTASDLAAAKALENNVAVVSAYNTSTSSGQLSFDMATSAVALFGVLTAKATGAPLAEGVAYDS